MTLNLGDHRRRLVRGLGLAGVAAAGYVFGITSDRAVAQSGQPTPTVQQGGAVRTGAPQAEGERRVVAYVDNGGRSTAIYRDELGDFLIARGGAEKLELLVNKRIIEMAAAQRGVTVTAVEVQAGLEDDLRGLGISKRDFEERVLPKYNKSLYEWVEDVIKPRLMLSKMCQDRVKVTDEDVQKLHENRYGERRAAQIICWSKNDLKVAQKQWDEARKSDADFDRIAIHMADPNLAAAVGKVKPLGRHPEAADDIVVKTLYGMKVGEISGILEVPSGLMCVKYIAAVPAEADKPLDAKMKKALHEELSTKRLEMEIPKCFQELKSAAKPMLLLKGAPTEAALREGVEGPNSQVNPAGGIPATTKQPMAVPAPRPMQP